MGGEVKELEARANELSKVSFPLGRSSAESCTPQPILKPQTLNAITLKAPWTIVKRNWNLFFDLYETWSRTRWISGEQCSA